jgi:hypothetical protein
MELAAMEAWNNRAATDGLPPQVNGSFLETKCCGKPFRLNLPIS